MKKLDKLVLKEFRVLTKEELKELKGGSGYRCSCNGSYAGDADSPEGCIRLCGW